MPRPETDRPIDGATSRPRVRGENKPGTKLGLQIRARLCAINLLPEEERERAVADPDYAVSGTQLRRGIIVGVLIDDLGIREEQARGLLRGYEVAKGTQPKIASYLDSLAKRGAREIEEM